MTSTVKLYSPDISEDNTPEMVKDSSGDYVSYDDYVALEDSLSEALNELNRLKEKITELYWKV